MTILEIQLLIEDDGLDFCIENKMLKPDDVTDVILADKLHDYIEMHKDIMKYIQEKVEELKDGNSGNDGDDLCDLICR